MAANTVNVGVNVSDNGTVAELQKKLKSLNREIKSVKDKIAKYDEQLATVNSTINQSNINYNDLLKKGSFDAAIQVNGEISDLEDKKVDLISEKLALEEQKGALEGKFVVNENIYTEQRKGFKSIDEIKESVLINEELFEKLKPYLFL